MKTKTPFVLVALFCATLCTPNNALAQGRDNGPGSGGDPLAAEIYDYGMEGLRYLRDHDDVLPSIDRNEFERTILALQRIDFEGGTLLDCVISTTDAAGTFTRTLRRVDCNYAATHSVRVARDAFANATQGGRVRLALHIFLGLHGISDMGYRVSGPIMRGMMADRAARAQPTFPLVGEANTAAGRWMVTGHPERDYCARGNRPLGECLTDVTHFMVGGTTLGAGGGFTTAGTGFGGGIASGYFAGSPALMNNIFPFVTGSADLRVAVAQAKDRPVYQVRFEGAANFAPLAGFWVAVEANQFGSISEEVMRLGWSGINIPIHLNDQGDFVLIRFGVGASFVGATMGDGHRVGGDDAGTNVGGALTALLRVGAFFVDVRASGDQGDVTGVTDSDGHNLRATRVSGEIAMSYLMSLIFPNDAIRVDAQHVRYFSDAWTTSGGEVSATVLSAYYELRF